MIYPIGIQDFEGLRNDNYIYVDKTRQIYKLVNSGKYYFLSRPRRFGKSLLISTLEAYFSGKKDLFKGLAIETLEKDWKKYPVFHLDLNPEKYDSLESLYGVLNEILTRWEKKYGKEESETSLSLRFLGVVRRAAEHEGERVVILVDEYDKPLLQAIGNDALQDEYRRTLKAFYSILKTQDRYIRFALLTGVTKFSKVSVFSDLNNLQDISMDYRYVDICGITEQEVHDVFGETVKRLAAFNGLNQEECYAKLKRNFDGYHFAPNTIGIYNPFSLLNTFAKGVFSDYWFETGTPTFLVELLKGCDYDLRQLTEEPITQDILNSVDSMRTNPVPIIYQSGYLTIKSFDNEFKLYKLGFPNQEVENGFMNFLMPLYTPAEKGTGPFIVSNFINEVRQGNPEGFMRRLQTLFEDNDYRVAGKMEIYFQNTMYVIFKMMGFYTEVERATSHGRIDLTIKTKDFIYLMEIKLDGTADEALEQIERKGYAKAFSQDIRTLYRIGVNFSSVSRSIGEWKVV